MESAPAAKISAECSNLMPPIATSGMVPIRFFHSVIFGMPCGANCIDFSVVGKRSGRAATIVGLRGKRGRELGVVMGGDAERQARLADSTEVGIDQVFLAEMQMLGAGDDRRTPVIVDHELGRSCPWSPASASVTICSAAGIVELLGAQLDGADAKLGQPPDPRDAVDDGIEIDQDTACQNGVPIDRGGGGGEVAGFHQPGFIGGAAGLDAEAERVGHRDGIGGFATAVLSSTAS